MKKWLRSVYSDSTRYFVSKPNPSIGDSLTIRLQMQKNKEIKKVLLRYREFGVEQLREMKLREEGGFFQYYTDIMIKEKRFHYQFYLVTEKQIYYYTQYRITDYIPDESRDFVILADFQQTSWVCQSVFYQIFPDRFCNGRAELSVRDAEYSYQGYETQAVKKWDTPAKCYQEGHNVDFYGGDLYGIIEKLDYLQELGVNAVYLNPVFLSPSVHKYDSLDYFKIDDHLGGEEALAELSQMLHNRGMRLVLDISINHTSSDSIWFNKSGNFYEKSVGAYHNPESVEREFYFFEENNDYDTWCGVDTMPKLDYRSQELRDLVYRGDDSVLKKWMKKPYNIDGWRFDVADCLARNQYADVHEEVLKEIREHLKKLNAESYLLAEDWTDCSDDLQGDCWDACMNYFGCARPIREFAGENDLFVARYPEVAKNYSKMSARQLGSRICQFYGKLPGVIQYQMFNLLDSHDVARLHNNKAIDERDYEIAVMLVFAMPGTVSVYYGDEIGLSGSTKAVELCRNPMNWEWKKQKDTMRRFVFYQKLIELKRSSAALQDGSFCILLEEGFVFSCARFTPEELIIFMCSTDDEIRAVTIDARYCGYENRLVQEDLFGKVIKSILTDEGMEIIIPPHTGYIIRFMNRKN